MSDTHASLGSAAGATLEDSVDPDRDDVRNPYAWLLPWVLAAVGFLFTLALLR